MTKHVCRDRDACATPEERASPWQLPLGRPLPPFGPRAANATSPLVSPVHSYRMKTRQFKRNWNDRSWKHRSCHVSLFAHGLKEGHGDQRAARTPCKKVDPRGISRSAGLSARYLGLIERATVSASVTVLGRLAQAFRIDPCDLIRNRKSTM